MKTVFKSLPETAEILAVMILSFSDSKTSQSLTIESALLQHVMLTANVLPPMYVTLSCNSHSPQFKIPKSIDLLKILRRAREEKTYILDFNGGSS